METFVGQWSQLLVVESKQVLHTWSGSSLHSLTCPNMHAKPGPLSTTYSLYAVLKKFNKIYDSAEFS